MMSSLGQDVASPDTITLDKFNAALEMHSGLIEAIDMNSPGRCKQYAISRFSY